MTILESLIKDGLGKIRYFEQNFLLADTSMNVVKGMLFLSLSNADVLFDTKNLTRRTYSTAEALSSTMRVQLIDKHKIARAASNENSETFVIYVAV